MRNIPRVGLGVLLKMAKVRCFLEKEPAATRLTIQFLAATWSLVKVLKVAQ